MRINQFIARNTGVSRRAADKIIEEGKVHLNGVPVELGQQVEPDEVGVTVNGKPVRSGEQKTVIIMINKPKGYISTREDPEGRKTVMDLVPDKFKHLKPVGRLDIDSEGLILLTNDGQLHYESTHPKFKKEKEYLVQTIRPVTDRCIQALQGGVEFEEGLARADSVRRVNAHTLNIIIHQGWKRQVRRMIESCHNTVDRLVRLRVDTIELGDLKPGKWKQVKVK